MLYWFFSLGIVLLTQWQDIGRAVNTIDSKQSKTWRDSTAWGFECLGFIAQLDAPVRLLWLQYPASYKGGFSLFIKVHFFLKVTHLQFLKEIPIGPGTSFSLRSPLDALKHGFLQAALQPPELELEPREMDSL